MWLSDYSHPIQWLVKNKVVNAPIKFEEIVMFMIMIIIVIVVGRNKQYCF